MINFIICCSQGMSSSALMKKMQDYVKTAELDVDVKAVTTDRIMSGEVPFDVLMLGPQSNRHHPDECVRQTGRRRSC